MEEKLKLWREEEEKSLNSQRSHYEDKIKRLEEKWEKKLSESQNELREALNTSFMKELEMRKVDDERRKLREREELQMWFENELKLNEIEYQNKLNSLSQVESRLKSAIEENDELKRNIETIRSEFQECIERFSRLRKQEADFLFSSLDFDEKLLKSK